jgi:AcrR family transcriptional regulator
VSEPAPTARRWERALARHRADQRDEILAAALGLLRERGMAGLTMAAIAEAAGISRPTLYHYFADLDALLAAWVGREVERSVGVLVANASAIPDPVERLGYLVAEQCRTFAGQDHRLGAEHFESEAAPPAVRAEVMARMAPLRRLLAATLAEAGAGVDPELGADAMLGMLGVLRRRLVSGDLGVEAAVASAMRLLTAGWLERAPRS